MPIRELDPSKYSPIVALLGGTLDTQGHQRFAETFGRLLQSDTRFRMCVSGFKGHPPSRNKPRFRPSFAFQAVGGATQNMTDDEIRRRILTRYHEFEPASDTQFAIGDCRRSRGRNVTSRGLSIISESDVVCLCAGATGTTKYFEYARAMDKPVIPLPFLGQASRDLWEEHAQELSEEYGTNLRKALAWDGRDLDDMSDEAIDELASKSVAVIRACARLRCLIFMPFSVQFNWVFENIIEPSCEMVGAEAIRLDLQARAGDIVESFEHELGRADCAIAVVTQNSPNVFYEVGYAHALNIPVVLLAEDTKSPDIDSELAFYLRNHRKVWFLPKEYERGEALATHELSKLLNGVRKASDLF